MSVLGQLQFRRDLAANWTSNNPILLSGELGLETDTDKFKIGDGTTAWNALPYGGIKGDTGVASQTIVGATTVINPNQSPSVTDADAGPNADLRFSLPRAREVVAQTTNTVTPGTAASVAQAADAEGDVLLTFNIPRGAKGWTPILANVTDGERRVLRLIDYIDGEGTKPTIPTDNYIGSAGFTNLAGATDIRGAVGQTGPAANAFTNIAVTGQTTITAEQANDTLTVVGSGSVTVTTDAATDTLTIAGAAAPVQDVIAGAGLRKTALSGAITLINRLSDGNVYFAADYGTLTSGTDTAGVAGAQADANTATIQAAINAAAATTAGKKPGGIVLLPPGTFHISSQLNISTSCVVLMGAGAYGNSDVGAQTGFGTALFWNNTASASTLAMVKVFSPVNPSGAAVKRAGVEGITLQCAGNIGRGLYVESIHFGSFKDIYIINATNQGLFATCLVTGTQLGEAADNTKCVFENISVRMIEAGASATGIRLDGVANANTSNSVFRNIAVLCTGAQIALDLGNTDSNHFYSIVINQTNGSTVQPVRLRGGTAPGLECRGNVFYYLAAGGSSNGTRGMYNEGTETAGITAPAKNNAVFGYSIENGEPYPIIGTGATLFYQIIGGTQPFKLNSALVADTAFTNAVIPTVASLVVPANAITPGTTFEFTMAGSVINTTAASNLVCDILINGAAVATATLALGTTAAASPGRGFWYQGSITFRTVGASGTVSSNGRIEVAALGIGSNQVAPTAINTTAAVTLAMRINTSAATSTGTVRQATIIQGN